MNISENKFIKKGFFYISFIIFLSLRLTEIEKKLTPGKRDTINIKFNIFKLILTLFIDPFFTMTVLSCFPLSNISTEGIYDSRNSSCLMSSIISLSLTILINKISNFKI